MAKDDFKHEIINIIGTISEGKKGWKKELTRISWNGAEPTYDIRSWSDDHQKMSKGITMDEEELRVLKVLIDKEIEYLDSDTF